MQTAARRSLDHLRRRLARADALLPLALAGIASGLVSGAVSMGSRQIGVVHVMENPANNAGRLPWRNAMMQFFGAAVSIVSGHSVGREGPVVHVGAAASSLLGQWLRLPNNSIRTLVIGATAGGALGIIGHDLVPAYSADSSMVEEFVLTERASSLARLEAAHAFGCPWVLATEDNLVGAVIGRDALAALAGRHRDQVESSVRFRR